MTLTVLRCPPAVVPETRTLTGGEYTVGRGPGVDWVLSDVNQMVSRRHCTLAFRAGSWQVIDDSANGTFCNHDEGSIGKGNKRDLRDHDRLRIGPYEIEVHLAEDAAPLQGEFRAGEFRPGRPGIPIPAEPFGDDPFADPLWPAAENSADGNPFVGRTQEDHSSALNDALRPPNPVGRADDLLPEGWENDLLGGVPPVAPEVAAAPVDAGLLAAFLAGAGLPDARPADPAAMMRRLGETYRAMVSELRAVLIARASVKSEFRIEQTLIRARGNNPLKFSANDDDAVAALLGVGRHTDMAPAQAVANALRDIRLHELASMAAMQSAVRALLAGLEPETVRASAEQGGGLSMLPNQKKARAWDAYEALHARVARALSDDFDSVFGKAFARAYEEALDDLVRQERS